MSGTLIVYSQVSTWSVANAATRNAETPAKLISELAHAMFNVTMFEDGELETALLAAASKDERHGRAMMQLSVLLRDAALGAAGAK